MTSFVIIEQHDGRYIVVAIFGDNSISLRKGDTIISYEMDCRSITKCYAEIAEYVVESGIYCDGDIVIRHIQRERT